MNSRRSNIEVIADILRMKEASKTQIMYRAGMSYAQLQKYLDYLTKGGLLVLSSNGYPRGTYTVSDKGELLLRLIENIEDLLYLDNGANQAENIGGAMRAPKSEGEKTPTESSRL